MWVSQSEFKLLLQFGMACKPKGTKKTLKDQM